MRCGHCDKKLGFFKKPVDGLYCSDACRNTAQEDQARQEREAEERARERVRLEAEQEAERAHSDVVARRGAALSGTCPKCSEQWRYEQGAGASGLERGECSHCGFESDFMAIEQCENCRCVSMIVRSDVEARCARCKTRRRVSRSA